MRGLIDAAGAGRTVLVPNAELAAALFDAVERAHLAAGHEVWPTPRIRDFGGWLRERYQQRQLADATLPRCLSDIEERELWRAVVRDSDPDDSLLEPAGAARAARRARRTLVEYGIPIDALMPYGTDESVALLDWNARFESRCRELGCVSSDRLLAWEGGEAPDLVWIDSPLWRPVARAWLQRRAGAPLAPLEVNPVGPVTVLRAASPSAELAHMASWAGERLRARPEFRAWICLPDLALRRAEVRDAFDAVLVPERLALRPEEAGAPYAVAGGTPLADYAPVRAALEALSAASGPVTFDRFSVLLRLPELQSTPADAAAAAALDVRLRTRGRDRFELAEWLRLCERVSREGTHPLPAAVTRLGAFLALLTGAPGRTQPLSRWVSLWMDAFDAVPWAERHRWSSTEYQAAERCRELLGTLATADALFGPRSADAATRILLRAARESAFQAQTGVPPIWISAQVTDPWLAYDAVWIGGCAEDRWPPPLDPVPLIPIRLQRQYGVVPASVDGQLAAAEDLQRRWRARAPVTVFSAVDPGDGRIVTLSPLLPVDAVHEVSSALPQPHWRHLVERAPSIESLEDELAPPFDASSERTRGVATVRAQSRCPFRGFAESRLEVSPLEKPVPGFNQRERGDLLHHALEGVWRELGSWARLDSMPPPALSELIRTCAAAALAKQCTRRDPGEVWRRRETPRLQALVAKWLDTERLRAPFEVEGIEQGSHSARFGGLEYRVRIDRVDRLSAGGVALIDYKTGSVMADWRGERPDNPQLPMYALLRPEGLVAVAYGKVNAGECTFVAEAERGGIFKERGRPSAMEGRGQFASLVALWSDRVERIAGGFASGHAEVAPTPRACGTCHLQPLCRVPSALSDAEDAGVAAVDHG